MYRIMIVENDPTIASLLCENLGRWGFDAVSAVDFGNITRQFVDLKPHLILLDISLPFFNGYHWCSEIRKISKVPIMFLSSRSENMDIVMAMNMGGDDYITKPFSLDILIAKVQALLRRAYSLSGDTQVLETRGLILDLGSAELRYGEHTLDLTKNEFRILQLLMEQKNRVVTREQIMKRLWDNDSFIDDNTLTVNINRLRRKLAEAGIDDLITTKKGVGYIIHD